MTGRRRTSSRLIAVASEAKAANDAHRALHDGVSAIIAHWSTMEPAEKKRALEQLVLANMPTTIDNSVYELAHFAANGKRIVRERVRRQAYASAEGRAIPTDEPSLAPFPMAVLPQADEYEPTPEEKAEYEAWIGNQK